MKPLIDADILRYEVGFGSQFLEEDGETVHINSFDQVKDLLHHKIDVIVEETWADEKPTIFLTNDKRLHERLQRRRLKAGQEAEEYVPCFREAKATTKPYKGGRTADKPYHYDNLTDYIIRTFDTRIAVGIEADDLISITHRQNPDNTIICSRDKDLRQTPGLHYGWQCGKVDGFGPLEIDELGFLELKKGGKIFGGGLKFFYAQMLMGDGVDNIPGIPNVGPVKAFNRLSALDSEEGLFLATFEAYKEYKSRDEEAARAYFKEQAALLWMIRELDKDGNLVHYKMFDER